MNLRDDSPVRCLEDTTIRPRHLSLGQYFVMTKSTVKGAADEKKSGSRCRWCRRVVPHRAGPGRPREFCSQACRQWDWVGRQRARELQISEDELVVARQQLEELYDDLYVLSCAVTDTESELRAGRATVKSLTEAMNWLLDAAKPLRDRTLQPASKG